MKWVVQHRSICTWEGVIEAPTREEAIRLAHGGDLTESEQLIQDFFDPKLVDEDDFGTVEAFPFNNEQPTTGA